MNSACSASPRATGPANNFRRPVPPTRCPWIVSAPSSWASIGECPAICCRTGWGASASGGREPAPRHSGALLAGGTVVEPIPLETGGRFRARGAQFTPYYSQECPGDLPKDWIASVYRHPRSGALVIVSNLSRQEGRATLKPDWKASASTARPGGGRPHAQRAAGEQRPAGNRFACRRMEIRLVSGGEMEVFARNRPLSLRERARVRAGGEKSCMLGWQLYCHP